MMSRIPWRTRKTWRWGLWVGLTVAINVLFVATNIMGTSGLIQMPVVVSPQSTASSIEPSTATPTVVASASSGLTTASNAPGPSPPAPVGEQCNIYYNQTGWHLALAWPPYQNDVVLDFGPGCNMVKTSSNSYQMIPDNVPNAEAGAADITQAFFNYMNITNSEVANMNATMQETLSYYENRAEAIVPYFVSSNWTQQVYDQIAIDSGLVPSIEGATMAFGLQQYQIWNATASAWMSLFGPTGTFNNSTLDGGRGVFLFGSVGSSMSTYFPLDTVVGVSAPWQTWSTDLGASPQYYWNTSYFNLAPGGTIINADTEDFNNSGAYGNYTLYDLTKGTQYYIPNVNYTVWNEQRDIPIISSLDNISQFDLLKIVRNSAGNASETLTSGQLEMFDGYAFHNITPAFPDYPQSAGIDSGVYGTYITYRGASGPIEYAPVVGQEFAVGFAPSYGNLQYVGPALTEGDSQALGNGAGSVIGGNQTLTSYSVTMQNLVNNTMKMAYDYWLTLRAITDLGKYTIPPNCAIPYPSDAFPAATDMSMYDLSTNNIEAVYLSYLNAVAQEYGQAFTTYTGFCGDPDLGFSFNWTESWHLQLNITGSLYLYGNGQGIYLNGTTDPYAIANTHATWPIQSIDPILLYPYEYQLNVPLGTVFPVPVNDPIAAVLVNYTGNLDYGKTPWSPNWGVPAYVTMNGAGDYVAISGYGTNISSGTPASQGDALYLTSCLLDGQNTNPCPLSVTYFNNFTIGLVHALFPPVAIPPTNVYDNVLNQGQMLCGTGVLNQWYDSWTGAIVSSVAGVFVTVGNAAAGIPVIGGGIQAFFNIIGCLIGWIVVIFVLVLIAWLIFKAIGVIRARRGY